MTEIAFHRPRKVTLVEGVVEQIVAQIQSGNLKPGDRLPSERQLIETFQVGRSSVREALQGLAVMGLIEIRPGHGSFVARHANALVPEIGNPAHSAKLQYDMRLHLIAARRLVECETARLAALNAGVDDVALLNERYEAYRDRVEAHRSLEAAHDPHHDVHIAIAQVSGNPFLAPVVDTLLRAVPQSLRLSELMEPDDPDLSPEAILDAELDVHLRIVRAIEAGDAETARAAMAAHMDLEERLVHLAFGRDPDNA
jgi:DNA-binding FadR family transcriptional regulator